MRYGGGVARLGDPIRPDEFFADHRYHKTIIASIRCKCALLNLFPLNVRFRFVRRLIRVAREKGQLLYVVAPKLIILFVTMT